ncbi:MAG: ABC transporter ATP-binding protein [Clostridiales bacterium]
MTNAITIRGLEKALGNFHLSIPSLNIPQGYVTGFIGENGAGKTTTIKLMMNGLFPDAGKISLLGTDSRQKDQSFKQEIAYVGDRSGFLPQATLAQIQAIYRAFFPSWDQERFQRHIRYFDLNLKKPYKNLSSGQQKVFALCLALAHHPRLLLMDEPTANLDPLIRQEFLDILRQELEQEGVTVFFSSHITSDLDKIADYILFIHKGKLMMELTPKDQLMDTHRLVKGDSKNLTAACRSLLLNIQDNGFGFSGLTTDFPAFQALAGDAFVYDLPALEDIFINYIRGEQK